MEEKWGGNHGATSNLLPFYFPATRTHRSAAASFIGVVASGRAWMEEGREEAASEEKQGRPPTPLPGFMEMQGLRHACKTADARDKWPL